MSSIKDTLGLLSLMGAVMSSGNNIDLSMRKRNPNKPRPDKKKLEKRKAQKKARKQHRP